LEKTSENMLQAVNEYNTGAQAKGLPRIEAREQQRKA